MNTDDFARELGLRPADLGVDRTGHVSGSQPAPSAAVQRQEPASANADVVAANASVLATPKVRAAANRLGVRLSVLEVMNQGQEDKPRITLAQVQDAAALQRPLPRQPAAAAAAVSSGTVTRASLFDNFRQVTVNEYGTNPVVDDLRQIYPEKYAAGMVAGDPPPTLFATGDLPIFTASGLPVTALSALPWSARIPAARADHAEATQIINYFTPGGGRDRATLAAEALMFYRSSEGNREYIGSLTSWLNRFQYIDGKWQPAENWAAGISRSWTPDQGYGA